MKKNIISGAATSGAATSGAATSGAVAVLFGLLITLGPQFLFRVCEVQNEHFPTCHWAGRAEISTGLIIAVLGICLIFFSDVKTRLGLTIGIFLTGIVSLVILHKDLIGLCKNSESACNKVTFPALIIICALTIIGSVINMIYLERKTRT